MSVPLGGGLPFTGKVMFQAEPLAEGNELGMIGADVAGAQVEAVHAPGPAAADAVAGFEHHHLAALLDQGPWRRKGRTKPAPTTITSKFSTATTTPGIGKAPKVAPGTHKGYVRRP